MAKFSTNDLSVHFKNMSQEEINTRLLVFRKTLNVKDEEDLIWYITTKSQIVKVITEKVSIISTRLYFGTYHPIPEFYINNEVDEIRKISIYKLENTYFCLIHSIESGELLTLHVIAHYGVLSDWSLEKIYLGRDLRKFKEWCEENEVTPEKCIIFTTDNHVGFKGFGKEEKTETNLVEEIEGRIHFHYEENHSNFHKNGFIKTANVFETTEKLILSKNFDVLHFMRDTREDSGDDGGYMVVLSIKNGEYYIHILGINYNGELNGHVLDDDDLKTCSSSAFPDFVKFSILEECKQYLEIFISDLEDLIVADDDEGGLCYVDDIMEWNPNFTKQYATFLSACISSYSEYRIIDRKRILGIVNEDDRELNLLRRESLNHLIKYQQAQFHFLNYKLKNSILEFDALEVVRIGERLQQNHYGIQNLHVLGIEHDIKMLLWGRCKMVTFNPDDMKRENCPSYIDGKQHSEITEVKHPLVAITLRDVLNAYIDTLEDLTTRY